MVFDRNVDEIMLAGTATYTHSLKYFHQQPNVIATYCIAGIFAEGRRLNFRAMLVLVPMRTICELFAEDGKPRITAKNSSPLKIPAIRYVTAIYLAGQVLTAHSSQRIAGNN